MIGWDIGIQHEREREETRTQIQKERKEEMQNKMYWYHVISVQVTSTITFQSLLPDWLIVQLWVDSDSDFYRYLWYRMLYVLYFVFSHGSVFDPTIFIKILQITRKHGMSYHLYTDDSYHSCSKRILSCALYSIHYVITMFTEDIWNSHGSPKSALD